jgi:ParB-like chromosome segregation protein Spo0J
LINFTILNASADMKRYYQPDCWIEGNARLAFYTQKLGYQTAPDGKGSFKVVGVPDRVRKEFSQRKEKIEAAAKLLETQKKEWFEDKAKDLGLSEAWIDAHDMTLDPAVKGRLGARTRGAKKPPQTTGELLDHWNSRVTEKELAAVRDTVARSKRQPH